MKRANLQPIIDLLRTEQILERNLSDVRQEISAACAHVAINSPGIHTSPDMVIADHAAGEDMPESLTFVTTERLELGTDGQYRDGAGNVIDVGFSDE